MNIFRAISYQWYKQLNKLQNETQKKITTYEFQNRLEPISFGRSCRMQKLIFPNFRFYAITGSWYSRFVPPVSKKDMEVSALYRSLLRPQ